MKYNIYAEFWNVQRRGGANFSKIEKEIRDVYQKIKLSSLHLITEQNKRWARENKYKQWVSREYLRKIMAENSTLEKLVENDLRSLKGLRIPYLLIRICFRLRKPYLSKDDEDFYIINNPVVKDKVFKIPIIRSTTWKGVLRRVVRDIAPEQLVVRLFGNEKESEESKQGRLFFYPTFLNGIDLDVITPLERKKKSPGKGPILFEVVPEGSIGEFKLLYLPFDIINNKNRLKKEIREDWEVLKDAIPKMMLEYGFSAKKTSGYGVVEDKIEFRIDSKLYRYHSTGSLRKGGEFEKRMNELIDKIGEYYVGKQD